VGSPEDAAMPKQPATSTADSPLDFAVPYELMVGVWNGMCTIYTARGEFHSATQSMVAIYWKQRPTLLHYRQIEQQFPTPGQPAKLQIKGPGDIHSEHLIDEAIAQTTNLHFDLQIDGKYCKASLVGSSGLQSVEGTQTRPGVYIFHLGFRSWRYYNNQYFIDPNERHIIGPCIRNDNPAFPFVAAQAFTRVSYDVPPVLQSDLAKC
jgi:hypothetical protein